MSEDIRRGAFPPPKRPWTVRKTAPAPRLAEALPTLDTRYSFTWLDADGMIEDRARMGPSTPIFTESFAALGRGALVQTADGPIAVEDLLPGDRVVTARGLLPLLWKGSRVIAPQHGRMPLYRITSDALGPSRPQPDLVLGPAARLVSRRTRLRSIIGADVALMPVASLDDGETVIRIRPISAMQVFQLGFDQHTTYTANGVEMDSVHPGSLAATVGAEMQTLYLSMFPHIRQFDDFGDLMMTRLQGEALERLTNVA